MTKKATKPLHLQKQKSPQTTFASNASSLFGPRKLSSNAWYGFYSHSAEGATTREEEGEDDHQPYSSSWDCLKKQLIEFHDTAKVLSFKSLVEFWNHDGRMDKNSLGGSATLPFEHAEKLYGMATIAMELRDYHGAKVMILAAGLLHQTKVTDVDEIIDFVEENNCGDASYEDSLAETLPFCYDTYMASKSPDTMTTYLNSLNIEQLKTELASSEPLITLVFNDGTTERTVPGVNSLITLNTALSKYGDILPSKISRSVRVKHNGTRLFLSGSGKKSLSDLGIVDNDVIEIEDINAISSDNICIDITNKLNGNLHSQSSATGKRSKRKGKKKGKGKK